MNWRNPVQRNWAQWKFVVFRFLVILVLLGLLIQPETWHLALALDATALDALALLLEAQLAAFVVLVHRQSVLPVAKALWRGCLLLGRSFRRDSMLGLVILEGCIRQIRGIRSRQVACVDVR